MACKNPKCEDYSDDAEGCCSRKCSNNLNSINNASTKKIERERRLKEFFDNNPQPKCANPKCNNLCFFRARYWKWSICCSNSCVTQYTHFIAKQDDAKYKQKKRKAVQTKQKNLDQKSNEEIKQIYEMANIKRKQTLLERYGTSNIQKIEGIQDKRKRTCLERYGTESPLTNEEVKQKILNTMKERYGVENPLQNNEINKKRRQTNLDRYGQEEVGQLFLDDARDTTRERYGVDYYTQTEEYKNRRKITMDSMYGGSSKFYQNYTEIGKEIMEADDIELLQEMNETMSLTEISMLHGMSLGALVQRLSKYGVKAKVHYTSLFHKEVLDFLINECGVTNFRENVRDVIAPHEIDILIDEVLGIECNGLFWHSQNNLEGRTSNVQLYHQIKTNKMRLVGKELIHIFQSDWIQRRKICESIIKARLNQFSDVVYGRKTNIQVLDTNTEREFFTNNHIQGYTPSVVCYGLYYGDVLVFAMSFVKSRYHKKSEWELLRLCTKLHTTVVGGADRLFTHFTKEHSPKNIVSYCHLHLFTGKVYQRMGFTLERVTKPGYWYTKDYRTLHHRSKFQKHKLITLLPMYDEELSEWENMKLNKWDRIWDCGNAVYIWNDDSVTK